MINKTEGVHLVKMGTGPQVADRDAVIDVLEDVHNITDIVKHALISIGETHASQSAV